MLQQVKVDCQRKNWRAAKLGIDSLPDDALRHVLSFLTMREAVQTCVLARRWRHLWRSIPTLRIICGVEFEPGELEPYVLLEKDESNTLISFVNNLLLRRDRDAPLDLCEFHISPSVHGDYAQWVSSWIQQALLCIAKILKIRYDAACNLMLSNLHFMSVHLARLDLKSVSVTSDFSSCPVLHDLRMVDCDIDKILSKYLKQLTMIRCRCTDRISAPSVVWLELTDNFYMIPLLESMPSL